MKVLASLLNIGVLLLLGYLIARDGLPLNVLEWLALLLALSAPVLSLIVFWVPGKR